MVRELQRIGVRMQSNSDVKCSYANNCKGRRDYSATFIYDVHYSRCYERDKDKELKVRAMAFITFL
jgi:hypothetical protein